MRVTRGINIRLIMSALVSAALLLGAAGCSTDANHTDAEYVQDAKALRDKGDWKGSILQLKNAVRKNPSNSEARWLLGRAYVETGNGTSAEKELLRARELGVMEEAVVIPLGNALSLQGAFDRVISEIMPLSSLNDNDRAVVHVIRGEAYMGLKKYDDAEKEFQTALNGVPTQQDAKIGMARLFALRGNMDDANTWVDKVIAEASNNYKAWVLKGDLSRWGSNADGAITAYNKALELEPDLVDSRLQLAYVYLAQGEAEKARKEVSTALQRAPNYPKSTYLMALLDFKEKKFEQSRNNLEKVLKVLPDHLPSLLLNGEVQSVLGSYEQATDSINKFLARVPNSVYGRKLLATVWLRRGDAPQAIAVLQPLLSRDMADSQVLALAGEAYLRARSYSKASDYLSRAVAENQKDARLRAQLGMSQIAIGQLEMGVREIESAMQLDPNLYSADIMLIETHIHNAQYDKALALISDLEKKQPDSPLTYNYKGIVLMAEKKLPAAISAFEKALELDAKYFPAVESMAQLDMQKGDKASAKARFIRLLERDPANVKSMLTLAHYALLEHNEKEYFDWIQKAARADPKDIEPQSMLVNYYLSKNRPEKALPLAREAYAANAENATALELLGKAQLAAGDNHSALASYEKLVGTSPDSAELHFNLARVKSILKDVNGATEELKQALKLKPAYMEAKIALANLDVSEKKYSDALKIVSELQKEYPKKSTGWILEGDVYMLQKKYLQAAKAYEKAHGVEQNGLLVAKIHQSYVGADREQDADRVLQQWLKSHPDDIGVRLYQAQHLIAANRQEDAKKVFESILAKKPDNVPALNNLAWLLFRQGDQEAVAIAKRAYQAGEQNAQVLDTYGWILLKTGKANKGKELLEKAVALAPSGLDIRYHLAVALLETGDKERAKQELQRIVNANVAFTSLNEAKKLLSQL